jgi:hypothetical protein
VIPRDELRRAIVDLNEGWNDADAVTADMLRPLRRRELGPVLARRNYRDARDKIVTALAYLVKLASESDDGPADPSGNGGAGPAEH